MQFKLRSLGKYNRFGRTLLRAILLVVALVLFPVGAGIGSFFYKAHTIVGDTPAAMAADLPPVPQPGQPGRIAVVLLSNNGTEITDALPPYELLAASGAFNTYFVAPERRVSPMTSALELPAGVGRLPAGLEVLPHYSFADYERIIGRDPDLVVIPNMTAFLSTGERPILDWIRGHAGPQTTILSICSGSRVLAATGLLDGHTATGLHLDLAKLQQRYPAVRWQAGVRWVDDRQFITSGTLTAGIDATLHAIDRLAGRAVAERAGQALGYQHLGRLDNPALDYRPLASPDLGMLPNAMYQSGNDELGVVLYDGISETALAALLDVSTLNMTHISTVAAERTFIRSRYGMIIAPRYSYANAPALDRVIVLGGPSNQGALAAAKAWNARADRPHADMLATGAGAAFAYDAVIADVEQQIGGAVARSDSANFVYPVEPGLLNGAAWTPGVLVRPVAAGLFGLALALILTRRAQRPAVIAGMA